MAALRAIREQHASVPEPFVAQVIKLSEVQELEIEAVAAAAKNNFDESIQTMREATALEEAMSPPPGPPPVIKPSHELFGEILLRAGRPQEAAMQCAMSLRRHPNRALSLLGAARAAAQSGNTHGAADAYAKLVKQWQQADAHLPELHEARNYAEQAAKRQTQFP